LPNAKESIS